MTEPLHPTFAPSPPLVLAGRVVDLDAGVLRDASGAPITLRPQAWAVLALLARQVGKVVAKTQLLDTVWAGRVVTDGSLARAVSDLRAAFGSDGHRIIKTAARRGYLLLAPAQPAPDWGLQRTAPLPASRGPLFGRAVDLANLCALMARHRLVTIVGAGGVGKTAIAVAAARSQADAAPAKSAWIDLAQLADPLLLAATVARSLGLPIAQRGDQLTGLLAALAPVSALLVLDNAEHLVAGVSRLTRAMLDAAPGLRVLVTSQAPLHVETEHVFRLTSLDVPASGTSLADASGCGAVALFVDLAQARDRHFELGTTNLGQVIELCRRLEGLPLAIRLAVARLPLLGLSGVVARLDERLQLLAADERDVPARQQTLLAALAWSHSLLQPHEQALFRRLGAFVGGFSLELAIAMAADEGVAESTLIDTLNVLVDRNLVDADRGEPRRYRMLETQREYAWRQLRSVGDMTVARRGHAVALAQVMRKAFDEIWLTADAVWLPRWAPELDNVRAALDWSAANDATLFASIVGTAAVLFRLLDLACELRHRAEAVNAELIEKVAPEVAMHYWLVRSYLEAGVSARSGHDFAHKAERLARDAADARALYIALCHRVTNTLVAPEAARNLLAEIRTLEADVWGPRLRAHRPMAEFVASSLSRQWAESLRAAEAGCVLTSEAGTAIGLGIFANCILVALLEQGRVGEAIQRSKVLRRAVLAGPPGSAIPFIGTSARCALLAGDAQSARRELTRLFEVCRTVEWTYFDFFAVLYVNLALTEGRTDDAARLLGHADTAAARIGGAALMAAPREQARTALALKFPAERLSHLMAEGASLNREAVCALVLGGDAQRSQHDVGANTLTARQTEVLRLIGQGQTDKQAARTLGLSPRTVEMHVARAIDALQCRNRAEAVRIAAERGLMGR